MSKPTCYSTKAFSAASATSPLGAAVIERRVPTASDVQIQILYCGVCHSRTCIFVRDEWPLLHPVSRRFRGSEIVGRVTCRRGRRPKKFKVGDTVGVGCLVDSCRTCPNAAERAKLEQFLLTTAWS